MSVNELMISQGPSIYYSNEFRNVLEDHMSFLRADQGTRVVAVDPGLAYRYEHDLYSYLRNANVEANIHWLVMRMNGMTTPMEFGPEYQLLAIPDIGTVDRIRQSHMSSRKLS